MNTSMRSIHARSRPLIVGLVVLLIVPLWAITFVSSASAALSAMGPTSPDFGDFPSWYQDQDGLRLEPCIGGSFCLATLPDPGQPPLVAPDPDDSNFPDEIFWWQSEAALTGTNVSGLLSMAMEGAFLGPDGAVRAGDQATFGRIRIRIDVPAAWAGQDVTVFHPFGQQTFNNVASGTRAINVTEDIGCVVLPCDFSQALSSNIGPFLTWDTFGTGVDEPPAGYIGDPNVPHQVTGSVVTDSNGNPQNYARIDVRNDAGTLIDSVETDLFTVQGKIAGIRASANPKAGTYNQAQSVVLTSTDPAASIYYTLDGTTPDPATSAVFDPNTPIAITAEGATTLTFLAVNGTTESPVVTEVYTIDRIAPTVSATPASGSFATATSVALAASEAGSTIRFTLNDADPTPTTGTVYTGPINLPQGTTVIRFMAIDAVGNASAVVTESYVLDTVNPTVSASPVGGLYTGDQSVTLTMSEPGTIYYTTDGSTPTTASASYSSPISITQTTTLKFMGVDALGNSSAVTPEVYTLDKVVPTVAASPAGGTYQSTQVVEIEMSEPGSIRYCRTTGCTPTTGSTLYTSPITISATTTLKFIAIDTAGNQSDVVTEVYTIGPPPNQNPPTVQITAPVNGSTVVGSKAIKAKASDNTGVAGVQFFIDGVAIGAEDTVAGYSVKWNSKTVANGQHTLTAVARDTQGNTTTSAPITVTVANPVVETLAATVAQIESGTLVSGSAASLATGNNNRLIVASALDGANQVASLYGQVTLPANKQALVGLKIVYDGGVSVANQPRTLALFNFDTNGWDDIRTVNQPTANRDVKTSVTVAGDVTRYLSAGGEIRLRVTSSGGASFQLQADMMTFTISYLP